MNENVKTQIVDHIKKLVVDLVPEIGFRTMYGGTVIELKNGESQSRIGGIFIYADYVSLEFTKGSSLIDEDGVLEGTGKLRRHLKLRSLNDIRTKGCQNFLRLTISDFGKLKT